MRAYAGLACAWLCLSGRAFGVDVSTVEELLSAFKAEQSDIIVTQSLYKIVPTNGYESYARYNEVRARIGAGAPCARLPQQNTVTTRPATVANTPIWAHHIQQTVVR